MKALDSRYVRKFTILPKKVNTRVSSRTVSLSFYWQREVWDQHQEGVWGWVPVALFSDSWGYRLQKLLSLNDNGGAFHDFNVRLAKFQAMLTLLKMSYRKNKPVKRRFTEPLPAEAARVKAASMAQASRHVGIALAAAELVFFDRLTSGTECEGSRNAAV